MEVSEEDESEKVGARKESEHQQLAALSQSPGPDAPPDATGRKPVFAKSSHSDSLAHEDLPRSPAGLHEPMRLTPPKLSN
ncbi:hypothetical protein E4U60_000245 [Claviceps pazoutovae]|uniref:Uncharacterized protein n=1 Tax=Claviceps pazoutovae TaxID=1649127 RepID=A0A9P7MEK3_9HYPO|nr:hypothetical protein E4U60_000245 [Claviceps pazoutovae]